MNNDQFEIIFEDQVAKSRRVLVEKAREYATDGDRLHNFNISAGLMGGTPEKAAWGFMVKHLASIADMVNSGEDYPMEMWEEKLGDAMNYLFFLKAIVVENQAPTEFLQFMEKASPALTTIAKFAHKDPVTIVNHFSTNNNESFMGIENQR